MIDWIDDLAKDWARYIMRSNKAWPSRSILGRIVDEGSVGAAIRSHIQVIPINDMPADVMEFHRAWNALRGKRRQILWVHYCSKAGIQRKISAMRTTKTTYYYWLDSAQIEIWQVMDQQK